ncbi:hypothetical protein K440DRAFT_13261 [Wilcoxina mikolae CBS 423.85]|nr:hypothetical protein K440DRAFT_13261 [Wilcoxina mikolae CBS 423.85]
MTMTYQSYTDVSIIQPNTTRCLRRILMYSYLRMSCHSLLCVTLHTADSAIAEKPVSIPLLHTIHQASNFRPTHNRRIRCALKNPHGPRIMNNHRTIDSLEPTLPISRGSNPSARKRALSIASQASLSQARLPRIKSTDDHNISVYPPSIQKPAGADSEDEPTIDTPEDILANFQHGLHNTATVAPEWDVPTAQPATSRNHLSEYGSLASPFPHVKLNAFEYVLYLSNGTTKCYWTLFINSTLHYRITRNFGSPLVFLAQHKRLY